MFNVFLNKLCPILCCCVFTFFYYKSPKKCIGEENKEGEEEEDEEEEGKQLLINFDLKLPSFDAPPTALIGDGTAPTIAVQELKPVIEELAIIIPTSTINKRRSKMRKRKFSEDSNGILFL